MLSSSSKDESIFTDKALEDEFTTWTLVFSRDMGALVFTRLVIVDNDGNVVGFQTAPIVVNHIDRYNVLTQYPGEWTGFIAQQNSASGKYVTGFNAADGRIFTVYRKGVLIFQRNSILDNADLAAAVEPVISPNGRFLVLRGQSTATGNWRYILLYEGA